MRGDPFEKADFESSYYDDWRVRHAFLMLPAAAYVGQSLATFRDFPPRQRPASFSIDQVLQSLQLNRAN
jgi:hypothetical protein